MDESLPPVIAPDTAPGTSCYARHYYGKPLGTLESLSGEIAAVLPPGIPPGMGYPPFRYPIAEVTTAIPIADPCGTPRERRMYARIEGETGRRLRRDLDALRHPRA
jgi:hypothetical protein